MNRGPVTRCTRGPNPLKYRCSMNVACARRSRPEAARATASWPTRILRSKPSAGIHDVASLTKVTGQLDKFARPALTLTVASDHRRTAVGVCRGRPSSPFGRNECWLSQPRSRRDQAEKNGEHASGGMKPDRFVAQLAELREFLQRASRAADDHVVAGESSTIYTVSDWRRLIAPS